MDERLRLKEKVQHGSAVFPINVYEKIFVHENNTLLPHWHDEFEIVYLEKGTASFRVDGKEYFLGPKQFYLSTVVQFTVEKQRIIPSLMQLYLA